MIYIILHLITFILQCKRFLPFPRKHNLNIHVLMYNKPVHTQDLGEQVDLDIEFSYPADGFCGSLLWVKYVLFIEMNASMLNSSPVEGVSKSGFSVLQVSLSFCSIKILFYFSVTVLKKQQRNKIHCLLYFSKSYFPALCKPCYYLQQLALAAMQLKLETRFLHLFLCRIKNLFTGLYQ